MRRTQAETLRALVVDRDTSEVARVLGVSTLAAYRRLTVLAKHGWIDKTVFTWPQPRAHWEITNVGRAIFEIEA